MREKKLENQGIKHHYMIGTILGQRSQISIHAQTILERYDIGTLFGFFNSIRYDILASYHHVGGQHDVQRQEARSSRRIRIV